MYLFGKGLIKLLNSIFFKEIHIEGTLPGQGPSLFYCSHMNCYLDTYPIVCSLPNKISIVIAGVSTRQKVVGFVSKLLGGIAVERPVDHAVRGTGKIHSKNGKLIGTETKFTQELGKMKIIEVNGKEVTVLQVEKDNLAVCSGDVGNEPSAFRIQPHLDNSQMFRGIFDEFRENHCVLIMPEGRSHETPGTIKFKSGIGKIVLSAMQCGLPIKVYAFGVNYTGPERLRNRVKIKVSDAIVFRKEELSSDERKATKTIVEKLQNELKDSVINIENYLELKFIYFVTNLIHKKNHSEKFKYWKKLESKLQFLKTKDTLKFKSYMKQFDRYQETTSTLKISKYNEGTVGADEFVFNLLKLLLLLFVTFIGLFTIWLSSLFIETKAEQARKSLLRNISFRKTGCDTINSNRSIYILAVYPLIVLLSTLIFHCLSGDILLTATFIVCFPCYLMFCWKIVAENEKIMKLIRFYFLFPEVQSIVIGKRNQLEIIAREMNL